MPHDARNNMRDEERLMDDFGYLVNGETACFRCVADDLMRPSTRRA